MESFHLDQSRLPTPQAYSPIVVKKELLCNLHDQSSDGPWRGECSRDPINLTDSDTVDNSCSLLHGAPGTDSNMELQPPCLELSSSDSSFEEANSISLIETEQRPSQEQSEDTFKERAHSRYTLLPECFNVEGTHSAVCIMLGDNQEAWPFLTDSVPLNWQKNGTFFVDTSTLKDFNDVKCDDNGGWQNDGVRRLWLIIKGSNLQDSN